MQGEGTRGKRQQRKGKNISEKREMNVKKENLRTFALRCSTWLDAMGYVRGLDVYVFCMRFFILGLCRMQGASICFVFEAQSRFLGT
ncbi:hypothetical protein TNIN_84241 [Trichonephila inaurata madagascariensis]|uniref:Uncharacterized protein n=1 Tax=Trichonephila inaurata madagascariensis TaxID=2747483 RepID=A0A8X6XHG4_9ARAC|nr:hypothetical protein TNIN_84241 [Trichonephila inaurata madagascariensis]